MNKKEFIEKYKLQSAKGYGNAQFDRSEEMERDLDNLSDGWIPITERPLYTMDEKGRWTCTEDGDRQFLAAIPYCDKREPEEILWWIRHCVIVDEVGLCVVGDDVNEPAGWDLEAITHWQPLPQPPQETKTNSHV